MSNQSKLAALASTGVTKAELNNIDGGTARGTTAVADGDGFLTNDGGTMRMTKVDTLATYMGTKLGGGLEFIATADASGSTALAFTGFDSSKYDSYLFTHANILPATDDQYLRIRLSVDSGSNYLAASDSYTVDANAAVSAGDSTYISFGHYGIGNAASDAGFSGDTRINGPHLNVPTYVTNTGLITRANGLINRNSTNGAGKTKAATVVNAVQFSFTSGNIASGTITMYGMVNS